MQRNPAEVNARSRVTIRDVARSAGVSIATVSRVLTGSSTVAPTRAQAVWDAASRLGYRVDPIGRALRRRETTSAGVVVPNINNPFFPALIQAVEAEFRKAGWSMLLAEAQDDVEVERECLDLLIARRVDRLLVSPVDRRKSRPAVVAAAREVAVMQLDRRASSEVPHVGVDHARGTRELLEHLRAQGRSRMAFAGADPSEWPAHQREVAFRRWAGKNYPDSASRMMLGDSTVQWGRAAAAQALERWPDTDALVCANDLIGVGALLYFEDAGIPVPRQVAVTGFDDTVIASITRPTLTSVAQPVLEVARLAVEFAHSGEAGDGAREILVPPRIVLRASSS